MPTVRPPRHSKTAGWRQLDLPHDWAVEAPFDAKASSSHGYKASGFNVPERSIGWYRKTFAIPPSDLGRRISVEFDGVFRDSIVWVNGFYLGRHACGYTGFSYDLTDYLNYGGDNAIAVRVDATMEEGWFYEGAGIYRHVWLVKTAPLHVPQWGTYVTTEVGEGAASRHCAHDRGQRRRRGRDLRCRAEHRRSRRPRRRHRRAAFAFARRGRHGRISLSRSPSRSRGSGRWSRPRCTGSSTTIRAGGAVVDRYETPFGIRTIRFDPDHGFFLNGRHVEIHGTNNHQDHAGVGVALPDALQAFRVARLKEIGVNAYRSSHNPPTPEFLDACDRLGLLVLDENRLMGVSPEQLGQLESMIRRDRNHPERHRLVPRQRGMGA